MATWQAGGSGCRQLICGLLGRAQRSIRIWREPHITFQGVVETYDRQYPSAPLPRTLKQVHAVVTTRSGRPTRIDKVARSGTSPYRIRRRIRWRSGSGASEIFAQTAKRDLLHTRNRHPAHSRQSRSLHRNELATRGSVANFFLAEDGNQLPKLLIRCSKSALFDQSVILLCVRWYLANGLSLCAGNDGQGRSLVDGCFAKRFKRHMMFSRMSYCEFQKTP